MDVVSPLPIFNLYNFAWPIYTSYGPQPPVKVVQGEGGQHAEIGDALLSPGVGVTGRGRDAVRAVARRAGRRRAEVSDSVLLNGVRIGAGAIVRNAILDKNVVIPPGAEVGVDRRAMLLEGSWSRTG